MTRSPPRNRSVDNEFDRGLMKRLYGSMILLDLLNQNLAETQSTRPDSERVTERDPKDIFRGFVNKIAHICDVKHGGDNVTAAAILQSKGAIEYRLASNSRTNTKFAEVKKFLKEDILGALGSLSNEALNNEIRVRELCSVMLLKIVAFNRGRINVYIKSLSANVGFCIRRCREEETGDGEFPSSSSILFR